VKPLLDIFVPGLPAPGGSKRYVGGARIIDDAKRNKPWRDSVAAFALEQFEGPPVTCPVHLFVEFYLPRAKAHYGTGRNAGTLKPSAPRQHKIKPDVLKLTRSTEDALTGIVWADDAQVVHIFAGKQYVDPDPDDQPEAQRIGAAITVRQLRDV